MLHHSEFSDRELIELGFWAVLVRLERLEALVATDFTEIEQDVAAQATVVDSVVTLLTTIHQELLDAGTDPTALANLAASIESNTAKLAAAVEANPDPAATPPPPPPVDAPPPEPPTDGTGVADIPPPDVAAPDAPPADAAPAEGDASGEAAPAE